MAWADEVILISQVSYQNEFGEWMTAETYKTVFCDEKSVGRQEFYAAAVQGLKPSVILTIHRYEYDNQQLVEYKGIRYKVLKTYAKNTEEIELTCERTATGGPAALRLIDTELAQGLKAIIVDILASEDVVMDKDARDGFEERFEELLARWTS